MRPDALLCFGAGLLSVVAAAPTSVLTDVADAVTNVVGSLTDAAATKKNHTTGGAPAPDAFNKLHDTYVKNTKAILPKGSCSSHNIAVRKAW